jgi:hypothetical protein
MIPMGPMVLKLVQEAKNMARPRILYGLGLDVPEDIQLGRVLLASIRIGGEDFERNMALCPMQSSPI